ncbi:hypothetical protein [Pseudomonas oryzihabitans]|uniref:hypothetical protein n=1 Tax=Pseudomonas oryzihabitans TaxID=47885 RepID=UPI0011A301BB|nr:hypothetical protein [Pseudomonas psychrotolerans]
MSIGDAEYRLRMMFLDHLNLTMVMDQARLDPIFMAQLIARLNAKRPDSLMTEEGALLEWAYSAQRLQRRQPRRTET